VTVITSLDDQKSNAAPSAAEMGDAALTDMGESGDGKTEMETAPEPETVADEGQQEASVIPDSDSGEANTETPDNIQESGTHSWIFLTVSLTMTAVAGGAVGIYAWKKKKDRTQ